MLTILKLRKSFCIIDMYGMNVFRTFLGRSFNFETNLLSLVECHDSTILVTLHFGLWAVRLLKKARSSDSQTLAFERLILRPHNFFK